MIAQRCDWLRLGTLSGLWQLLHRLGISYKEARNYVHSPDRYYADKLRINNQITPAFGTAV